MKRFLWSFILEAYIWKFDNFPLEIKMCYCFNYTKKASVPKRTTLLNRTLCHVRDTVIILRSSLPYSVPMDCHFHSLYTIFHVNDNFVTLANLNTRARKHSVCAQKSSLHPVRQDTLTFTPHSIGCIRCAYLTRSRNLYNWLATILITWAIRIF